MPRGWARSRRHQMVVSRARAWGQAGLSGTEDETEDAEQQTTSTHQRMETDEREAPDGTSPPGIAMAVGRRTKDREAKRARLAQTPYRPVVPVGRVPNPLLGGSAPAGGTQEPAEQPMDGRQTVPELPLEGG